MDTIGIILSRGIITSCERAGNFKLNPLSYDKNEDSTFIVTLELVENPKNFTNEELQIWISNELNSVKRYLRFDFDVTFIESDPVVFTVTSTLK